MSYVNWLYWISTVFLWLRWAGGGKFEHAKLNLVMHQRIVSITIAKTTDTETPVNSKSMNGLKERLVRPGAGWRAESCGAFLTLCRYGGGTNTRDLDRGAQSRHQLSRTRRQRQRRNPGLTSYNGMDNNGHEPWKWIECLLRNVLFSFSLKSKITLTPQVSWFLMWRDQERRISNHSIKLNI